MPQSIREDAEGAAMIGLMEAVQHVNEMDSGHFGSYLKLRVRGAIRDEVRHFDPLSRRARELVNRVERAIEEYRHTRGYSPEMDQVALSLGLDEDECWKALELSELHTLPIEDDTLSSLAYTAEDLFVQSYAATLLRWALAQLDRRSRLVLRLWYKRGLPVAAIAQRLSVSVSRAHQLRVEAERRLEELFKNSPPLQEMSRTATPSDWDEQTSEASNGGSTSASKK